MHRPANRSGAGRPPACRAGDRQIRKVELQATRYRAGSFLRRHVDQPETQSDRRYACVLSLSKDWQSDWGGVLQFVEGDQVVQSINPHFNMLALFKVPQGHQVSYVAPYAVGARYSLTGWMRAD